MTTLFHISTPTQMRDRSRDQADKVDLRQRTRQTAILCGLSESVRDAETGTGGGVCFSEGRGSHTVLMLSVPPREIHVGGVCDIASSETCGSSPVNRLVRCQEEQSL